MRIISGAHRGRRLAAPKNLPVRPTTDMAKESLFNILGNRFDFPDLSAIDLFAGTGNISYELASRGCPKITAVDNHPACVKFIAKTAGKLDFPIQAVKNDVFFFLKKSRMSADLIFADPPYDFVVEQLEELVKLVFTNNLLTEGGLFIIEHSERKRLTTTPHYSSERKYGGTIFSFFE